MIHSMTGYAVASAESPRGALTLELRSVNSRFLDLQFRVAEELRAAEPMLRELISGADRARQGGLPPLLRAIPRPRRSSSSTSRRSSSCASWRRRRPRRFPGSRRCASPTCCAGPACSPSPPSTKNARARALERLCRRALDDLCAARGREGAKLAAILLERVADMRKRLAEVAPLVPEAVAAYRARLAERLREVLDAGVEERVRSRGRAVRRQERRRRGNHAARDASGRGRARAGKGRRRAASGWISSPRNSIARQIRLPPRPPASRLRIARWS